MNEWNIIYIILIKIIELQIIPSSTLGSWLPWIYNTVLTNKLYTETAKTFNHNVVNWTSWQYWSFNNKFGRTDGKFKFVKTVTTWLLRISRVNSFISINMMKSSARISETQNRKTNKKSKFCRRHKIYTRKWVTNPLGWVITCQIEKRQLKNGKTLNRHLM